MSRKTDRVRAAGDAICPICATGLDTGQGLYACPCCEWVGVVDGPMRESPTFRDRDPAGRAGFDRWDFDFDRSGFVLDPSNVEFDRPDRRYDGHGETEE